MAALGKRRANHWNEKEKKNSDQNCGLLPRVPEVFFSVSWEGKKTSGNGDQLTDRATPIGLK